MKELLVPVGSMESLSIAINAGADAVYLGGKRFGARAFANNFNDEEMVKAIDMCHLYGVKIYVTVNTLVYESELNDVLKYVEFLYNEGVDAIIVQDLGLVKIIRKYLPNLEIHASTQMHNTCEEEIKYLESLGIKRVVLARELSLDEINNINTTLEKEAFIHGALCISYSGECLFSSLTLSRSGNRGECAQSCRMKYSLYEGDKLVTNTPKYLLSTRDLNTSTIFDNIMSSSIYSLKIEGRMKSPEYVGCVTMFYRDLINQYYKTKKIKLNEEMQKDLMTIYNREYTCGFIGNTSNEHLVNTSSCNHLGTPLGKVIKKDKKYIYIKLIDTLDQGDGIRFTKSNKGMFVNFLYNEKTKLMNKGEKGSIVLVDNKFKIEDDEYVNKTVSIKLREKYTNLKEKKIPISISFDAVVNNPMKLKITDGVNSVTVEYGKVEASITQPITEDDVLKCLNKLGNTPYIIDKYEINVDNSVFINIKNINEIRRIAIQKLTDFRINKYKDNISVCIDEKDIKENNYNKYNISMLVRNEEQLNWAIKLNVDRIYVTDKKLYIDYKDKYNILYRTNRIKDDYKDPSLVTSLGNLKNGGVGDYFLNATNHETIDELLKYLDIVTLSVELSDDEIESIMKYYKNSNKIEIVLKSNIELMVSKFCPIKYNLNKDENCCLCMLNNYHLEDINGNTYPIITEPVTHITHILNGHALNKLDRVDYYKKLGINNFRIELLDETLEEVESMVRSIRK